MTKYRVYFCSFLFLMLTFTLKQGVSAYNINDTYFGANDHSWGDVIGDIAKFGISSMDVELVDSVLSVVINTAFANNPNAVGSYQNFTYQNKGVGYGGLFLANYWNPNGLEPYPTDNYITGTQWSYAFSFINDPSAGIFNDNNNRWITANQGDTQTGSFTIYSLENDSNILLSEHFINSGIYRNGQEVSVDPYGSIEKVGMGTWEIGDGYLKFVADITNTTLLYTPQIALHWGETCANDVIEGSAPVLTPSGGLPVPEPTTMVLLASGLFGFAGFRKKFKSKLHKRV